MRSRLEGLPRQRVLFVLGGADRWVAGYQSIFHDMIHFSGAVNAATGKGAKLYPLRHEDMHAARPDMVVVALEMAGASGRERRALIRRERRFWRRYRDEMPPSKAFELVFVDQRDFLDVGQRSIDGWLAMAKALHPDALANK